MKTFTFRFLSSLVWFPRAAMACATCYGAADAGQTHSMNNSATRETGQTERGQLLEVNTHE